jgi:hypothetical protein
MSTLLRANQYKILQGQLTADFSARFKPPSPEETRKFSAYVEKLAKVFAGSSPLFSVIDAEDVLKQFRVPKNSSSRTSFTVEREKFKTPETVHVDKISRGGKMVATYEWMVQPDETCRLISRDGEMIDLGNVAFYDGDAISAAGVKLLLWLLDEESKLRRVRQSLRQHTGCDYF